MEKQRPSAKRRATRPALIDPNQLYSIPEAAAALDRSRSALYCDLENGLIRSIKDGSRRKIAGSEIIRVSNELTEAA